MTKTRKRLDTEVRRCEIIRAIICTAERHDYRLMTREQIGDVADCTAPLVSAYFGSMGDLREFTVRHGVETNNLLIIGQAMAARHPLVRRLDFTTKLAAAAAYLDLPPLRAD